MLLKLRNGFRELRRDPFFCGARWRPGFIRGETDVLAVHQHKARRVPKLIAKRFAGLAYANDKKEISILIYKELINDYAENSTYWCLLGNSYLDFELYNLALVAYEKAAELSKHKEGWIYDNIGNLFNQKQLYDKAEESLKIALSLNDKSDYTHSRLSSVYTSKQSENKKMNELLSKAKTQMSAAEIL